MNRRYRRAWQAATLAAIGAVMATSLVACSDRDDVRKSAFCGFLAGLNAQAYVVNTVDMGLALLRAQMPVLTQQAQAAPTQLRADADIVMAAGQKALDANDLNFVADDAVVSAGANLESSCGVPAAEQQPILPNVVAPGLAEGRDAVTRFGAQAQLVAVKTLAAITVRSGPGNSNGAVGSLGNGVSVSISCFVAGQRITGPYGTEDIWDALDSGGFVPDALIYTGSNTAVVPACPSAQFGTGRYPVAWTGGGGFAPRSGPHTGDAVVAATLPDGLVVSVACEVYGDSVTDSAGYTLSIWDKLVSGGYIPNAYLDTQVNGRTPGVPACADNPPPTTTPSVKPSPSAPVPSPKASVTTSPRTSATPTKQQPTADPCIAAFGAIKSNTRSVFGGTERKYDRSSSLNAVCEGFGAPDSKRYDRPDVKCAILGTMAAVTAEAVAAKAKVGKDMIRGAAVAVSVICTAVDVLQSLKHHQWLDAWGESGCAVISAWAGMAGGAAVGVLLAETGPAAVAIGVLAAGALAEGLGVACGWALHNALKIGQNLEGKHEFQVAEDVAIRGKCLRLRTIFGMTSWDAVDC
ncbi:hypothetical protein Rhe02_08040 [Rhizocola hellebori]|uniref:Uncharacterized protein n=1 Tax=Rhizocola hellebori TaxID=1392758 RepID=A0A8J3Q3M2_9ACTN|nr:hypothetical protein [Rhizocola hellebori]GIH02737.1 hypothetical protein Rhe02_08040 [Rhizocola hellebori]